MRKTLQCIFLHAQLVGGDIRMRKSQADSSEENPAMIFNTNSTACSLVTQPPKRTRLRGLGYETTDRDGEGVCRRSC